MFLASFSLVLVSITRCLRCGQMVCASGLCRIGTVLLYLDEHPCGILMENGMEDQPTYQAINEELEAAMQQAMRLPFERERQNFVADQGVTLF